MTCEHLKFYCVNFENKGEVDVINRLACETGYHWLWPIVLL